jgi:hypothetical protein
MGRAGSREGVAKEAERPGALSSREGCMPVQAENFAEPEVAAAAVVGAAVASPSVRKVLRRSAVYGVAGVLVAYDKVAALAQGVFRGVRQATTSVRREAQQAAAAEAPAPAAPQAPAGPGAAG